MKLFLRYAFIAAAIAFAADNALSALPQSGFDYARIPDSTNTLLDLNFKKLISGNCNTIENRNITVQKHSVLFNISMDSVKPIARYQGTPLEQYNIKITPIPIDFGEVNSCEASKEVIVELENTSQQDAKIYASFDSPLFSIIGENPIDIPEGEKRTITIHFERKGNTSEEIYSKLYLVNTSYDKYEVDIIGKVKPFDIIYTDSIDFRFMDFCDDTLYSFLHIRNLSKKNSLELGVARFAQPGPFNSYLVDLGTSVSLPPGFAITTEVKFISAKKGYYFNEIIIPYIFGDCVDTLRIPIRGTIVDNIDVAHTDYIEFPKIIGCEPSSESYIYIKNTGGSRIDSIAVPDSSLFEFETKPEFASGLEMGDSLAFKVKYKPVKDGSAKGKIDITLFIGDCKKNIEIPFECEKEGLTYFASKVLDFGAIPDCDIHKKIEQEITLRVNTGKEAAITNISVGGDFVVGKNFETDLKVGELPVNFDNTFKCRFMPAAAGIYSGFIDVELEPCDISLRIELTARVLQSGLTEIRSELDFGQLHANEQAALVAEYVNSGERDLKINDVSAPGAPFSILSTAPSLPCVLYPKDTLKIRIEFAPKVSGNFQDNIRFVAQPCDISKTLRLKGEVARNVPSNVEIVVGDVAGRTGEIVSVPILLHVRQSGSDDKFRYCATIMFNKTLLAPKCEFLLDSIGEYDRYCTFEGETSIKDTVIKSLPFVAALGNSISTSINLVKFDWIGAPDITTKTKDGTFTLTDVCREGGPRLFGVFGRTDPPIINPNPTTGGIEIELTPIESGTIKLSLFDAAGKLVRILYEGEPTPGRNALKADISDAPLGIYYVLLSTPTQRFYKKLVLIK